MKYLLTLFISLIFISSCSTSEPKASAPDSELQMIIDNFFKKYQRSPSEAIEFIFSTNKSFIPTQVTELKDKLAGTALTIGRYNGYEQLVTKSTGSSLVLFSYLVKHDSQPLRFTFIFYKSNDKWILYKFKFDDSLDEELEESARHYFY